MCLDALVQPNHGLQLRCIERVRLLHLHTTLELLARQIGDDIAEIARELVPQTVVDVQLALAGRSKIGVVDDKGHLDKRFVVSFHRCISRRLATGPIGLDPSDYTRRCVELLL